LRDLRSAEHVRERAGRQATDDDRAALRRIHRARTSDLPVTTLALVEEYLEHRPDHWFAWTIRGDMLTDLRRFEDASASLRRALRLAPEDSVHSEYCYLGHLNEARGRYRKAEAWYRKALGSRPNKGSYPVFLGAVLAAQGRHTEAERHHREAIRLDSSSDESYLNLGYVLRAQGRYREAGRCFERALEIDPRYREARLASKDMRKVLPLVPRDGVSAHRRDAPAPRKTGGRDSGASSPD
jgi:tetratricopeptide (TPR) repeat protein